MKLLALLLLLTISAVAYGQKETYSLYGLQDFTYNSFIKNNFSQVEAYTYTVKPNGRVKDSTLLFKQELDRKSNTVFGTKCYVNYLPYTPNYFESYTFETVYNSNGQVVKDAETFSYTNNTRNGLPFYEVYNLNKQYTFNPDGKITKLTLISTHDNFSIAKHPADTVLRFRSIKSTIYDFVLNDKGDRVNSFSTGDSARLQTINNKQDSVKWAPDFPRHMEAIRTYYENGKVKTRFQYSIQGKPQLKQYYYYDNNLNLTRQIDSAGWDLKINPFLKLAIYKTYKDTSVVKDSTFQNNAESFRLDSKHVRYYDDNGNVTKDYLLKDGSAKSSTIVYTYAGNKVASAVVTSRSGDTDKIYFTYNAQGLLFEKKIIYADKTIRLVRYYYK